MLHFLNIWTFLIFKIEFGSFSIIPSAHASNNQQIFTLLSNKESTITNGITENCLYSQNL